MRSGWAGGSLLQLLPVLAVGLEQPVEARPELRVGHLQGGEVDERGLAVLGEERAGGRPEVLRVGRGRVVLDQPWRIPNCPRAGVVSPCRGRSATRSCSIFKQPPGRSVAISITETVPRFDREWFNRLQVGCAPGRLRTQPIRLDLPQRRGMPDAEAVPAESDQIPTIRTKHGLHSVETRVAKRGHFFAGVDIEQPDFVKRTGRQTLAVCGE